MDALSVLRAAAGRTLIPEEGEPYVAQLQPPASAARIAEVEREIGFALPRELCALVAFSAGIDIGSLDSVDLLSIGECSREELFGTVITLVGDGAGNYWIIELRPEMPVLGPVWFLCHDAPVLVYQGADLATFIADYLDYVEDAPDGALARVTEQSVQAVWTQAIDVPREKLLDASDALLRDFARELEDGWFIRDLRRAATGDGMPIGRFGPRTPLARAGSEFVFAYGSRTRMERLKTWFTGR